MKTRLATYKEFRKLTDRWIKLSIECAKIEFFTASKKKLLQQNLWVRLESKCNQSPQKPCISWKIGLNFSRYDISLHEMCPFLSHQKPLFLGEWNSYCTNPVHPYFSPQRHRGTEQQEPPSLSDLQQSGWWKMVLQLFPIPLVSRKCSSVSAFPLNG